jgi:hypothetical protein
MTDPTLSPAAQAVLDASSDAPVGDGWNADRLAIAAALRAAADQVVPEQELDDVPGRFVNGCCHSQRQSTRAELLAIAAELEAQ